MKTLAGVTFANDVQDGGRSRQEILAEILANRGHIITVDLEYTKFHNEETGLDEDAIKVREHSSREVIGWISRNDIPSMEHHQMTGFIRVSKNGYSVQIDNQRKPSAKQYHYAKVLCARHNVQMPAYDVRAYAALFAMEYAK